MKIIDRWNEYMGPKDERLTAEGNRCAAVGFTILLIGASLALYYGIMLDQVASTTDHALLTPLGQTVFPATGVLGVAIVVASFVSLYLETRAGILSDRSRIAQTDRVPWDYVALLALLCGVSLGLVTTVMRIIAEIQIVGIGQVAWFGDIAMGLVYFGLAFVLGLILTAAMFRDAIKRRQALERELED